MGGATTETTATKVANIQIQTSSYGLAKPVIYGTNRVSANLLWFGAFQATPHTKTTSSGGKGIGKVTSKDTTYTYSAAAILGLAEGPITGIGSVWRDKDKTTLAALGLTLFTGTPTQAVWSFLSGYNVSSNWANEQAYGYYGQSAAFTDQAINYSSTAYVAASAYDLGSDATVPNHGFEVSGFLLYGSGIVDANPAVIIPDMLTSTQYGVGMPSAQVATLTTYSNYIRATGLFVSPIYDGQRPTADCLTELADATNSAIVWSGGVLNVIPYGDTTLTGNGATYTPAVTPLFDFTDDDFQDPFEPVRVTRSSPADAINRVQVEFLNRLNQYNAEVVTVEDQDAIEKYGLKPATTLRLHMICDSATAKLAAQLYLQRMLYKRNTYEFELDARYPMLEPMDVVTLTDPGQGMSRLPVRIITVEEQDDGFALVAEDLPIGVASAARYAHDNGLRWQSIINVTPSNAAAPIIFELPSDPSKADATGLSVGIAVGGQTNDPLYGGCRIWLSLDGNNYKAEGTIYGNSRYGITTASLPGAGAGVDATSTLAIALRSNAQILSASAADRDKRTTLVNVGGEYLSFQTAALTATNAYNLTSLNRGLYGTSSGSAKAAGATFVYVDDAIAILKDLDLSLIGQTVYIKVTAFNTYGTGEQDLSAVSAYSYTITGNMKALETPIDFATGIGGATKPDNNATRNVNQGVHSTSNTYARGDIVRTSDGLASYLAKQNVPTGIALTNTAYWDLLVQGGGGTAGANAFQAMLTNPVITISTAADGTGGNYSTANGYMTLYEGATNRSSSSTFSVVGSPSWATINATTGYYSITDPGTDQAQVQFDVSYASVTYRLTLNVTKAKGGTAGATGSAGASAFTLVNVANMQIVTPNTVKKTSANAWDGRVKTAQGYGKGASISLVLPASVTGVDGFIALTTDPDDLNSGVNAWTKLDYGLNFNAGGQLSYAENGTLALMGTWSGGETITVTSDNIKVRYYKGASLLRTVSVNAVDEILFGTVDLYENNLQVSPIAFSATGAAGANGVNGASAFTLANVSNCVIATPSSVTKTSGGSATWNGKVQTVEGYAGGATISITAPSDGNPYGVGLTTDPTANASYDTVDYWAYLNGSGTIGLYLNGAPQGAIGTYVGGDRITAESNGSLVSFYKNGTFLTSTAAASSSEVLYGVVNLLYDTTTITGITFASAGSNGANGAAGANGLSIAASKPIISVQAASGGAALAGQLPKSTQIILFDGFTDVTASGSYSRTTSNCSVTNDGGGSFTVTGVGTGGGSFTVTASYGTPVRSITMTIPVAIVEKGQGAISATPVGITALTTSGSFVVCATLADLSVPDGATLNGSMNVAYGPTSGGNYTAQVKLTYQNITDGGAETDFTGSTATGGTATSVDPDFATTSGSVVNSTGGTKTFRIRAYARRSAGSGSVTGAVSGNLAGNVS